MSSRKQRSETLKLVFATKKVASLAIDIKHDKPNESTSGRLIGLINLNQKVNVFDRPKWA